MKQKKELPVLALRGLTVFPNMLMHFDVEREISVKALELAMENNQDLFLVAQKEIVTEIPGQEDLYEIGTICDADMKFIPVEQLPKKQYEVFKEEFMEGK